MKTKSLSVVICIIMLVSCKNNYNKREVSTNKFIDTIISVDSIDFVERGNPNILTIELAHSTLLEYFSRKEHYYPQEKISLDSLLTYPIENEDLLTCIQFDTLYKVHLNNDKIIDGILTYWQTPCGASGHCWQPHRAMIKSIGSKYYIINTDFIPESYLIDTIIQNRSNTLIQGKIYDCGNHEYIGNYKALINKR